MSLQRRVILDIVGHFATAEELRILEHPCVAGVILFSRNYANREQLLQLTRQLTDHREDLILCVDHEGGRVQRFREGFTRIPPMGAVGRLWTSDSELARTAAGEAGFVIGAELSAAGLDLSFTPVLDLDFGRSAIIGDRAFHSDPHVVGVLGAALIRGLRDAGMPAVGKHFPGHGYAEADSHVALPVDGRDYTQIETADIQPYRDAIDAGLAAVMPAHILYASSSSTPAGFSEFWLQDVLRKRLNFEGIIFSDDLAMEGAMAAGSLDSRARAALSAGCDLLVFCNRPQEQGALLASVEDIPGKPARDLGLVRGRRSEAPISSQRYDAGLDLLSRLFRTEAA